MPIFRNNNGNLEQIKETSFGLEKKIQKITEENLDKIFDLEFVKSEFKVTSEFIIDTLAFDNESSSFVIIEYKNGMDKGLMTQGLAYLSTMLDRYSDFITEYNEQLNKTLKKNDIDKSQSRVIFIAPSYDKNIIQASNLDLPIELWNVHLYENNLIEYLPTRSSIRTSIKLPNFSRGTFEKIKREIKTYTEEYHFEKRASKNTKELYEEIRDKIINLGNNIDIIIRKNYITFKTKYNFVYLNLNRKMIHVDLALKINQVQDPKNVLRDIGGMGRVTAGYSRITVNEKSQIPYMMGLVEQSYTKSIKKQTS